MAKSFPSLKTNTCKIKGHQHYERFTLKMELKNATLLMSQFL